MLPALPRLLLLRVMAQADIVLNTSLSEGMAGSVLEAMALGAPLLLRDNSGNRSVADDGVEALFFDDELSFLRGAAQILADGDRRCVSRCNAKEKSARAHGGHLRHSTPAQDAPLRERTGSRARTARHRNGG